jgi:hypothetical protein
MLHLNKSDANKASPCSDSTRTVEASVHMTVILPSAPLCHKLWTVPHIPAPTIRTCFLQSQSPFCPPACFLEDFSLCNVHLMSRLRQAPSRRLLGKFKGLVEKETKLLNNYKLLNDYKLLKQRFW